MNYVRIAPVSPKGQITLPKKIRKAWGIDKSKRKAVVLLQDEEGFLYLKPLRRGWGEQGKGLGVKDYKGVDPLESLEKYRDSWV